jgi:DNA-binding MarR family transcriptional regulator
MSDKIKTQQTVLHLESYWPYQITVLSERIAQRTSRIVKERGINLSQWRVMAAIAELPGRTSVEVVTITPMDKGIVSRATKALLEMGLVRRKASQIDGRISHLHLTKAGSGLYQELIPQVQDILIQVQASLGESEQQQLSHFLKALIAVVPDNR